MPDPAADPAAIDVQVHEQVADIPAAHWNALLAQSGAPTPFMRHEWLLALAQSGCASPQTGWHPLFLSARLPGTPADAPPDGVAALYAKDHSYGEYVFDWAWARAYQGTGQPYYPKLLCASPFTPVPGTRLLTRHPAVRRALIEAMATLAQRLGCSSVHLLFPDEADREALASTQASGWMLRQGVQFHWTNRASEPYADFTDFLAHLNRDKRKKIQQERRSAHSSGLQITARQGSQIHPQDWALFYRCYHRTYLAHGNPPYLSEAFFEQVAATMPQHWLMFTADFHGQGVAASLLGIDADSGVAWGRYWGALQAIDCLHFELCYYAPLAWCIEQGFQRFEGGAQGEHKMARGLLPVTTWSAHWLQDDRMSQAVAHFLDRESAGMAQYLDELGERQPFKPG